MNMPSSLSAILRESASCMHSVSQRWCQAAWREVQGGVMPVGGKVLAAER